MKEFSSAHNPNRLSSWIGGLSSVVIVKLLLKMPRLFSALFWLSSASLLINLFSLAIPLYFMQVYDRILIYRNETTLIWLTVAIGGVLLLDTLISVIRGKLAAAYAGNFKKYHEQYLMEKIYSLPEDELLTSDEADLDDKFRSINKLQSFFAGTFFQSILDLPFAFLFVAAIYFIGGSIVYFHIAILILFFLTSSVFYILLNRKNFRAGLGSVARLSFLREMLKQIHFIKAQSLEELMLRKLDGLQEDLTYHERSQLRVQHMSRFFGNLFSQVMIYGTVVLGGFMVIRGELTIGAVTALTMISRRIVSPLQSFNSFSMKLSSADNDLKNLNLSTEEEEVNYHKIALNYQLTGNFELQNVCASSHLHQEHDLENISFNIGQGKTLLVLNKDDECADTLMELFQGVRKPTSGKIILDGYILNNHSGIYASDQIALLPRRSRLYTGSILDNITYFNPNLHIQALDAAALLGLDQLVSSFPKGYETEMGPYSNNIVSSGIIQRIALARVLVHRPRLLICDRIDSHMDSATLKVFLNVLKGIKDNTTVILISSTSRFIPLADQIYTLEEGQLSSMLWEDDHV